jgi:hypothetical protein
MNSSRKGLERRVGEGVFPLGHKGEVPLGLVDLEVLRFRKVLAIVLLFIFIISILISILGILRNKSRIDDDFAMGIENQVVALDLDLEAALGTPRGLIEEIFPILGLKTFVSIANMFGFVEIIGYEAGLGVLGRIDEGVVGEEGNARGARFAADGALRL